MAAGSATLLPHAPVNNTRKNPLRGMTWSEAKILRHSQSDARGTADSSGFSVWKGKYCADKNAANGFVSTSRVVRKGDVVLDIIPPSCTKPDVVGIIYRVCVERSLGYYSRCCLVLWVVLTAPIFYFYTRDLDQ